LRPIGDPTAGTTTPQVSLTHGAPAWRGVMADGAPKPCGSMEAELTGGLQGGAATSAGGEGREWMPEFLHDPRSIWEELLHQNGREIAQCGGSPKGGDWQRCGKLQAMLRWRNDNGGGFMSFPKVLRLIGTCKR
jgi:hypothetical protein